MTKTRRPNWSLHKRRQGFPMPTTVFDVGVGGGTKQLYRSYPTAYHVLIEPVQEFAEACERWLEEYMGTYVAAAAGREEGEATIYVNNSALNNSSLSPIDRSKLSDRVERKIPVTTIDRLVKDKELRGPYILKIDTEGRDLDVLHGAQETLKETVFVISECWLHNRYSDEPSATAVTKFLLDRGFSIVDVLEIKFNKDGACRWANIVFANDGVYG